MTRLSDKTTTRRTVLRCRPLLIAIVLAAFLFASPPLARDASAGGYDVFACHGWGGGSASFASVADWGFAAYHACHGGEGIVARSVPDRGHSGFLQGAYQIFDAPPGTTVESIHGLVQFERPHCDWTVGVIASGPDLGGWMVWGTSGGTECGGYGWNWHWRDIAVNAPRVRLEARCAAGSCYRGASQDGLPIVAATRMKDVRVRVRDDTPPWVGNARGSLWTGEWVGGSQSIAFDASDGAGIRETVVRIDGTEVKASQNGCDYTQRAPCPQDGFSGSIETAAVKPDGKHTLTLQAVDTGGNVSELTRDVYLDNTPPGQPQELTLAGGDGWRAENDFDLTWRNPAEQDAAPIAGAEWELCTAEGASCVRGGKSGRDIAALEDVKVPAPGEYVLRVWLRDAAGNHDRRTAASPVRLRFDDAPPEVAFEPLDPDDATLLTVRAREKTSAVAQGRIEFKPRASDVWLPLSTSIDGARLRARLEDERLRDGVYDLRAYAADAAGNERTSTTRTDGTAAEVTLPIRIKTRLRIALVKRVHGKVRARSRSEHRIRYGRGALFRGRLATRERNPIQDAEILVFSQARRDGAPTRLVATLKTSRRGGFAFRAPKGVSRTIRFRYAGTGTVRSATRDIGLLVRARTTIRPNRRSFVNGETMRLRGKLRGRSIPPEGKLVELQVLLRGRWRTFATTRAARNGRWYYDYRFDGTRGRQTYRFRARVPREATYPYETGGSRVVRVHVRGL